ncbi:ATP-binding cassette domain-containing protein [Modestobacter muralis]|uniref:ATP-binding cassette domain-containing protein n=1 Tax=Modestobacter muralis TaxID=1608614 RepID=A0A6P0H1L5_9ACTN|nr:ATP-binding cassette domain-containing protein [Modestobacter muralis]NEK92684.1 ATP-binding cassette domain-containing protein [Modestobacter muralis]NEN49451.1 ATP-binding cassette domain-containing protein [Modestobacter muralis]
MIEVQHLAKRYGEKTAVADLTFTVRPGVVTGFLGPNGAGKSTTMRMIMGLDRPTSGTALVNGKRYAEHRAPLREVGALLEARALHPGRTARAHLASLAATAGLPASRVEEVLDLAGITSVADRRVGGFSLGMGQRLGVATALLGDPATVVLDEPVNGLDPDGVLWIRTLTRRLAAEGRTVFLSSHLMSEMAQTAEHLIVVGRGRLLSDSSTAAFIEHAGGESVRVRSPRATELTGLLAADGVTVTSAQTGLLDVRGLDAATIGDRALAAGIAVHELTVVRPSLEDAFMTLTRDEREYRTDEEIAA